MFYFASDIHLGVSDKKISRDIERRFVAWLDRVGQDAECIFLVGDIFDFWFEYRRVVPKGFVRVFGKLAELTDRGVRVVYFAGNHDMWIRDYFEEECGMEVYTKPQILTVAGKQLFIAHGDNMNIDNQPLLKLLNKTFHSSTLYCLFSALIHPNLMLKFGQWWSAKSRKSHNREFLKEGGAKTHFLIDYAREYSKTNVVDYFVFGHLHVAQDFNDLSLRVINLGSWEKQCSYAVMDREGDMRLKKD